jgi:DNA repair exonuclease SbcCD nuclease subunit
MKIAIIGDTHFGVRNDSHVFLSKYFDFFDKIFFPYLDEHEIDTVIHLGDFFDRRKYINYNTLHQTKNNVISRLSKYNTYLIVGNHDTYYKSTNDVNSPTLTMSGVDNLNIISEPTTINFDGSDCDLLPWIVDCDDTLMSFLNSSKSRFLFAHLELSGFELNPGHISEGISQSLFSRYECVFSGHYHMKQKKSNVWYLGSPYHITWADYGQNRGFHILDTDTGEIEFVKNTFEIFKKISYNDSDYNIEPIADYVKRMIPPDCSGMYIKVNIESKEYPLVFDSFLDNIYSQGPAFVTIIDDFNVYADMDVFEGESFDVEDTTSSINKYIDAMDIELPRGKDPLKKLFLDLYNETNL